jgi:branched-subunit amino acid aminotransferase/4-amino-4-deoxychorismate lyase
MPEPLAYLNGRFLPQAEARLPFFDAGFVLGATVSDLCRTFRHRLFRLSDHIARFRRSCELAQVPQIVKDDELAGVADELIKQNARSLSANDDLALVMFATPGPIGYYVGEPEAAGDGPPTLGMHTFPLPFARYRRMLNAGVHLAVPSVRHVPATSVDPRIKQRSRMHWWLADREVQASFPGATALLLNEGGWVTETAAANLLLVREGVVLSPPRALILGGISLLTIEELCGELRVPFREQRLTLVDCRAADEAMLGSTPYCLAPVRQIDDTPLPCPGPIFERLLRAWSERVGVDIRAQIGRDA